MRLNKKKKVGPLPPYPLRKQRLIWKQPEQKKYQRPNKKKRSSREMMFCLRALKNVATETCHSPVVNGNNLATKRASGGGKNSPNVPRHAWRRVETRGDSACRDE